MKKLTFLLILSLCFSITAEAQKKKRNKKNKQDQAYLNQVIKNASEDFDIMTAPEEWKAEPTVVLCQKFYFSVDDRQNMYTEVNGIVRKRILIQDKAAINYYSEYYYQSAEETGFKIIKPDGTEQDLDFDDAVAVETEVPSHYRSRYRSGKYFKIAVPNLEVGDIVDYYTIFKDDNSNFSTIFQISYDFPVVSQEYVFDINKSYTLYANSFNGAPDLEVSRSPGLDRKGKETKDTKRYILKDKMRQAEVNERWDYTYLTEPVLKIMAAMNYTSLGDKKNPYKTSIEPDPEVSLYSFFGNREMIMMFVNGNKRRFNLDEAKKLPLKEKVDYLYNFTKYGLFYESFSMEQKEQFDNGSTFPFSNRYYEMPADLFCQLFDRLLHKHKIKRQYVVMTPKYFGFSEDVVCSFEQIGGIYIPELDTYYWAPNNYTNVGETNYNLFGATGYRIDKEIKDKTKRIIDVEFPESKPSDDVRESIIDITITEDNTLEVTKNAKYYGLAKDNFSPFLLLNSTFAYDDLYAMRKKKEKKKMEIYHGVKEADKDDWRAQRYKKRRDRNAETLEERADRKYEFIKGWIETEYEVDEITGFDINSFGNEEINKELDVTYSFTTENYIQKAGPNLILDIGSMITSQVELTPEEIEKRVKPIELGTAAKITHEITVQIPEGMTVSGLDNLTINVDNEAGAFISTASQEGNTIKVNTEKIYKQEFLPVEKWSELVAMLEAAFDFSQKKVVLKKK